MKRSRKKWLNPTRKRLHPLSERELWLRGHVAAREGIERLNAVKL